MERCNGCNRDVDMVHVLDKHCNLPYCKDCLIGLENNKGEGKMYEEKFQDTYNRQCHKCGHDVLNYYEMIHKGKYTYDCMFCKSCLEELEGLIQHLKKN